MSAGGNENAAAEAANPKMNLTVQIENSGPCRKHVKVKVCEADIQRFRNEAVKELVFNAVVPGFRAGHVPRKLVERRFRKEVADQVKQRVLVDSLEQLSEDHKLDAINEPDLQVADLAIPDQGDFEYEFDVEVRPEFDMPNYDGFEIERPVRQISDVDVDGYATRFLSQFGESVPTDDPAESGDTITVKITSRRNGEILSHSEARPVRLRPVLRFQDAEIDGADKLMAGVKKGDKRTTTATISVETPTVELRGETVEIEFEVVDVERSNKPEMTPAFLSSLGVSSEQEFRDEIRKVLERQVTYEQRQRARTQVLEKITESANWDLPESLVRRQVENALRREILEMQQAGFTDTQIRARENELRQRSISTTRQALKEHFVLDRIAQAEKLEVSPMEVETEIHLMAMQRGESPRRVRARLEKQGMMENLMAQILERKAVDVVLDKAKYRDVELPLLDTDRVEAVSFAVSGEDSAVPAPALAEENA